MLHHPSACDAKGMIAGEAYAQALETPGIPSRSNAAALEEGAPLLAASIFANGLYYLNTAEAALPA